MLLSQKSPAAGSPTLTSSCVYNRLEEEEGLAGNVRDLIIGGIAKARYPGKYLGDLTRTVNGTGHTGFV